ncbi:hypothetical protein JCM3263A_11920 [Thermobifida fusca]|uniref:Uncharacterized protein n=1 Tax=Thermobifida fusca (strain YX) TaxID=269800 RepID=Q47S03_THEFY|nr:MULTISPECIES: hypothetical protein [Thermobifida]AAZ54764.1 hypothetical protein Tfu_0726 [Thermobifida fusca YX]MBO2529378.1 hypothetical protein [Thermobifida sp.]PPS96497.1 hypothetical protein BH05_00600 [Thermobifida fusca]PZN64519.1 MAG: hypothetical protein DIU53_05965 [Thermobifida fusca]QOS60281.1 hypothetical protein IM867_07975 [Thermobifida fusca]
MLRDREALEEFKDLKKRLNIEFAALDQRLTEISQQISEYSTQISDDLDDFHYPRLKRCIGGLATTVHCLDEAPLRVYAALSRVAKDVLLDDRGTDFWAIPGKIGYTPSGEIPRWQEEGQDPLTAEDDLDDPAVDEEEAEEEHAAELLDQISRTADYIRALCSSLAEIWTAARSAAEIGDDSALTFELAKLRALPAALDSALDEWAYQVDLLYEVSPESLGYVRAVVPLTPGQLELF